MLIYQIVQDGFPHDISLENIYTLPGLAPFVWYMAKELLWGRKFNTITVDNRGIEIRPGSGLIPWSEIEGVNADLKNAIGLKVRNPSRLHCPGGLIGRFTARFLLYGLFSVPVNDLDAPPADARAASKKYAPPGLLTTKRLDTRPLHRRVIAWMIFAAVMGTLLVAPFLDIFQNVRVPLI